MSGELSGAVGKITAVFTPGSDAFERVQFAAGFAARDAAWAVLESKLGSDRAFSNLKDGKRKLGAGFDIEGTDVILHLRPKGLWVLGDTGRRRSGEIKRTEMQQRVTRSGFVRTKKARVVQGGRAGKALGPFAINGSPGFRASSRYGPSRGLKLIATTAYRAERDVPNAAQEAIALEVAKAMKG